MIDKMCVARYSELHFGQTLDVSNVFGTDTCIIDSNYFQCRVCRFDS